MDDNFFKSDLEKDVWVAVFTRHEPNGKTTEDRMRGATALVLDLEQLDKLLSFGKWTAVAGEVAGVVLPGSTSGAFRSDVEKKIWVSAFVRPTPSVEDAKSRAKRAWELVLEFRSPQKDEKLDWSKALAEIAG